MKNKTECLAEIQKAVDLLDSFEKWENMAFVKALSLGIQGKKRESRLEGTKDVYLKKYMQSRAYDIFEAEIYPKANNAQFPQTPDISAFLSEYRKGLWEMYFKLHEMANTFVAPLCMRDLACPLYDRASCIKCAIIDLNRKIKRWHDMEKEGTKLHDLFIYETSAYNNHDEAEKLEESYGYKY